MFGRKPVLPVDTLFEKHQDNEGNPSSHIEYIENLKKRIKVTQEIVKKNIEKAKVKQKTGYDRKAKAVRIEIGDTVLVKILAFDGKHKISDKFEKDACEVIDQPNKDIPVFIIKSPNGETRTLHRNHLFLLGFIQNETDKEKITSVMKDEGKPIPKPRKLVRPDKDTTAAKEQIELDDMWNKKKYDVTELEIDSDESGDEFVVTTSIPGDARTPATVQKDEDVSEISVEADHSAEGAVKDTGDGEGSLTDSHPQPEDETTEKEISTIEDSGDNNKTTETDDDTTETHKEQEKPKFDKHTNKKKKDNPETVPKRSAREKTSPAWQKDYYLNQISERPVDRLQALDRLVNSGILEKVNADISCKLIDAIMK
ncbi:uncharacterized protein LOC123557828 isoform X2 [Mercenaria mercenaria]|uniref:uncharacterized protein LOC123557828 isoform X2 n=1 Tax=Mercenaria mercenaria TaxID=6596 RepID=UPI00234E677C|nr:uncharacterized protein LOC123557828 isoform X2 [Mercenaria mercenaria]